MLIDELLRFKIYSHDVPSKDKIVKIFGLGYIRSNDHFQCCVVSFEVTMFCKKINCRWMMIRKKKKKRKFVRGALQRVNHPPILCRCPLPPVSLSSQISKIRPDLILARTRELPLLLPLLPLLLLFLLLRLLPPESIINTGATVNPVRRMHTCRSVFIFAYITWRAFAGVLSSRLQTRGIKFARSEHERPETHVQTYIGDRIGRNR